MSVLELFHEWGSIQSFKVRLCLAELGLEWTSRRVDMAAFENLDAAYLDINPLGLVPTLRWQGTVIDESSVINELLNDLAEGSPLLPADPLARARARRWARVEDDVVHPAVRPPTFNLILKARVQRMQPGAFEAAIRNHPLPARAQAYRAAASAPFDRDAVIRSIRTLRDVIADMDTALRGSQWLAGATFSLGDAALAALVDRLDRLAMASLLTPYPHASAWAARIRARPSFATAQGPENARPDPLVDRHLVAGLLGAALAQDQKTESEA